VYGNNPNARALFDYCDDTRDECENERPIRSFYSHVPWRGFIKVFTGQDTKANRMICRSWVHRETKSGDPIYEDILQKTMTYFENLQELIGDDKND
jgi:hypothetical protein